MKKAIIYLLAVLPIMGWAQTQNYSLEQAMEAGVQNRFDLRSQEYDLKLTKNQIKKRKKAWIPNIEAEGNIQYNTHISPTYVPKGFAGFDEAGLLSLGAKNQSIFGLSISQPIYKPGINTDIKIAKVHQQLSEEQLRAYKIEIKNNISKAYLNVLLKKLQWEIAKNEKARFEKYATLAEGAYHNGAIIKNIFLRAKLDYQNAKALSETSHQNYELAIDYLKYQMNLPPETKIILTDNIDQLTLEPELLSQEHAVENRTEIKQLFLKEEENKLQSQRIKQNILPTVSLSGFYGQWYQSHNFKYSKNEWWAPQSFIGLKVSIPISGLITNSNNRIENQIQHEQIIMDLEQLKADVTFELQKSLTELQNNQRNMQTSKDNYQLSQIVYQNQQQQFEIGAFRFSDLLDTEKTLHEAEQIYIRSVYDYMMAVLEYRKAIEDL